MLLPVVLRHRAVWAGRGLAVASAAAAVAGAAGVCSTRRTATVACAERRGSSSAAEPGSPETARVPLFSFGVIADVQWLDAEDGYNYARTVKRCYRGALDVLGLAVDWWCARQDPPLFIAQLGDLIDGQNRNGQSQTALDGALAHLDRAPCPVVNLIGNHELYNFSRAELADRLGTAPPVDGCVLGTEGGREFYSFLAAPGWRFLVLDAYRDAVIGYSKDDPRFIKNAQWLSDRNPNINPADPDASGDWLAGIPRGDKSRRFVPYNGGLGTEQLAWLRAELHDAARLHERVVVLSHVILHPKACDGTTMVWDYDAALEIIAQSQRGTVVAVLCGHDHKGQYHLDTATSVHHITFRSPLNKGTDGRAFGLINAFDDHFELRGPLLADLVPVAEDEDEVPGLPATTVVQSGARDGGALMEQAMRFDLPQRGSKL